MAAINVNGVVYAVLAGPSTPGTWLTAGYVNGREKLMIDYYVALGTEGIGSKITMGNPLPVGAKVLSIDIITSAATSSLTLSVGDLDSATRYASADTGPATKQTIRYTGMIDATVGFYVIGTNPATPTATDNDTQIVLLTGGATLGAGLVIGMIVRFTTD